MFNHKVSILMTVFNSETRLLKFTPRVLLLDVIQSILNQTYQDFELIILDNLSSDGTLALCQSFANLDSRVKVYRDTELTNTEEAFGKLIKRAQGEFVLFANDDDLWDSSFLETLICSMDEQEQADLYFTNAYSINLQDKRTHKTTKLDYGINYGTGSSPVLRVSSYFINRNPLPKIFGLFRRESLEVFMPFKKFDELGADMDNLFFIKFFASGMSCVLIDEPLFNYRERPRPIGDLEIKQALPNDKIGEEIQRYINHQVDFFIESCREVEANFDYLKTRFSLAFAFEGFLNHTIEKMEWLRTNYFGSNHSRDAIGELISCLKNIQSGVPRKLRDFCFFPNPESTLNLVFCDPICTEETFLYTFSQLKAVHKGISQIYSKFNRENRFCRFDELIEVYTNNSRNQLKVSPDFEKVPRNSELPQISILVTSMNLEPYVKETVLSIINQKRVNLKVLLADGGSTDNSLRILSEFPSINLVSLKDDGFVDGLNILLESTDTPYVAQCCVSDSYVSELWLFEAIRFLDQNPKISLVWGFPRYQDQEGKPGAISYDEFLYKETPTLEKMYLYWLSRGFYFPEGNFVCRREVFKSCFITQNDYESNPVEAFLEFTVRFHTKGYLSSHIPTIANYGRLHQNQSGVILTTSGAMKKFRRDYQFKIFRERMKFLILRKKIFVDLRGFPVSELKISPSMIYQILFDRFFFHWKGALRFAKSRVSSKTKTKIKLAAFKLRGYWAN